MKVLFDREPELERLGARLAAAAAGSGAVVAIEGEPGIGKSALLATVADLAEARSLKVLRARGAELERDFPYGIVRQLFEVPLASMPGRQRKNVLAGAAALAAPVLEQVVPERELPQQSVLHGLYWLTANLAADAPLLVCVDDAHWADQPSLRFLSYLGRRVAELPVLILYAARPSEGAAPTTPAVAEPEIVAEVVTPGPLGSAATAELVATAFERAGSVAFCEACHEVTAGNPFLLRELLRSVVTEALEPVDATAQRVRRLAPGTISRAVLARLARLGPEAVEIARALAVLGECRQLKHLAALAGTEVGAAAAVTDVLVRDGILRSEAPLEFAHPVVRTAVHADMPPARRALAHREAARLLADAGEDRERIVSHLMAAGPAGDPQVVAVLREAAGAAVLRGAPDVASDYLSRALAEPPAPAERASVLAQLGSAELRAALPSGVGHLREAFDTGDATTRRATARELALALRHSGHVGEAVALLGPVIEELEGSDPEAALQLEGELISSARLDAATAAVARTRLARYKGRISGETTGQRLLLASLAVELTFDGDSAAEASRLAEAAIGGGRLLEEQLPDSAPYYHSVFALTCAEELGEAERLLDLAIDDARARGSLLGFAIASSARAHVLLRSGDVGGSEAEAQSAIDAARQAGWRLGAPGTVAYLLGAVLERGDVAAAKGVVEAHPVGDDARDTVTYGFLLDARVRLHLAAHEGDEALRDAELLRAHAEAWAIRNPAVMPAGARMAEAMSLLGERGAACSAAAEEIELARRWGAPGTLAMALRVAGLVEGGDTGLDLLRESAATAERSATRLEHARSLTELGAALRRAGHRRDSRGPLASALDLAQRAGAHALELRARTELLAAGARPRRHVLTGVDALTASERRIAELAASGLGNREIAQAVFVTTRTVEMHLTHAYQKLGIANRDELPAVLRTHS